MPLPASTPEQRCAAAAAATAARAARAEVCSQLKAGVLTVDEVLDRAETDRSVAKLRVVALLQSMPGIGEAKAATLLQRLGIARTRRLRGLGPYQKAALRREFDGG